MFCPVCGNPHDSTARFCPACGQQVIAIGAAVGRIASGGGTPVPAQIVSSNPYAGKHNQIRGNLMAWPGVLMALYGATAFDPPWLFLVGGGLFLVLLGSIVYCVGRFQHWYHAE